MGSISRHRASSTARSKTLPQGRHCYESAGVTDAIARSEQRADHLWRDRVVRYSHDGAGHRECLIEFYIQCRRAIDSAETGKRESGTFSQTKIRVLKSSV